MTSLLYYHDRYLQHLTGKHPECPLRLTTCATQLRDKKIWEKWTAPTFETATTEHAKLVHDREMIDRTRELASRGGGHLDADTIVSPESYKVALLASGAAIDATRKVVQGEAANAFCMIRPPGHHATADKAMGFCLLNNIAIAATVALRELEVPRILIVDWDVHHGNGTQDIFWRDENVAFFSMHRYPFYPGSGDRDAIGEGPGKGYTWNLPIPYGTDRMATLTMFEYQLQEFAERVQPDLVMISAGFDAHKDDPVGDLGLETEDFATLTKIVQEVADAWCGGRIVSMLEGGYNPPRLADSIEVHLRELAKAAAKNNP
ncbi:histone deacetylase [Blastopirellula marina]|uniref:Histone deacetylase n=1 Tax=Blastopirellula marina TaxID=124 RepID=A0A2S8GBP6_9BACT|nr:MULTISPECIES: histone deacetylase [Pirellulaceae]PQO41853.1 histone deacetylase [Blastopirellula marina]RCS56405.1 histone deacetylase [Bremerella cremea]